MIKKNRLFLLLIILVVLTAALLGGYLVYSKFKKSGDSPSQTINLQQLRGKLTPEVKQCIIDKLGKEEAQKLLEEVKRTKTVSFQTMAVIKLCHGGGPEGPLPAVTAPSRSGL